MNELPPPRVRLTGARLYANENAFFCAAGEALKFQGLRQSQAWLAGVAGLGNEATMCMHD